MRRLLGLALVFLVCLAFVHCGEQSCLLDSSDLGHASSGERPEAREVKYYDESMLPASELAGLDNEFGFRIFREIVGLRPDENVLVSPLSISMALGMVTNGAAGTTLDAMRSTLSLDQHPMCVVNACYYALMRNLEWLDPEVRFEIANSVWCCDAVAFEEPFLDACRSSFEAQVRGVDFGMACTRDTINAWVNRKTHSRIPTILDYPLNPATVVVLVNAMYFLGTWADEFDPGETDNDWFTLPDGSSAECRMMERPPLDPEMEYPGCTYSFLSHSDFQGIELPYGDSLFSMILLLPRPDIDVDEVISMLDRETWDEWMDSFCITEGRLLMPKFELGFRYEDEMREALTALGMGPAFDPGQADFSRICTYLSLWIDTVIHKTYIRVDEAGTEAAAVTAVVIPTGITPCPPYFVMYINRPFVFVIRDNRWGTVLFLGKVVNPGYLP
jgi:serine protease inhibitor